MLAAEKSCLIYTLALVIFSPLAAQAEEGKKIINCYWGHGSENGPGNNRFLLNELPTELCTHVTYASVGFSTDSWTLTSSPKELDVVNGTYKRFNDLKLRNPDLKTLLCLSGSGWPFKTLVADPAKRKVFIQSVVDMLTKYNFDGFDIDWEYPEIPDKDNFMNLFIEMRLAFGKIKDRRLLISAAVSHNPDTIRQSYDAKILSDNLDFINVMTYDYHGFTHSRKVNKVQVNAPLYYLPRDEAINQCSAFDMEYWQQQGADPAKLLLGIPAYGRGFILKDPNQFTLFSEAVGPIAPPLNISDPAHHGYWAFNEYCDKMRTESDEWKIYRNSRTVSPYAVNGVNWLGFEDAFSAKVKAEYVRDMGFGGVLIWTIGQDDHKGFCGKKFGLTSAMAEVFNQKPYP